MTLDTCITKRKELIAQALKKELEFAIQEEQLGVTVDSVDIQDVRVVDDELFDALQKPSTEGIKSSAGKAAIEAEQELEIRRIALDEEVQARKKERELKRLEHVRETSRAEAERAREEAEEVEGLSDLRQTRSAERKLREAELASSVAANELRIASDAAKHDLEVLKERLALESKMTPEALQQSLLSMLPQIAESVAKSLSGARIHIHQSGPDSGVSPLHMIIRDVFQAMDEHRRRTTD